VYAVLDYKTQKRDALRKLLAERDDVQLACYALLRDGVVETSFVAADEDPVCMVPANRAAPEAADAEATRLSAVFSALRAGAGLAALGDEAACSFCEMGGLCRRQHWEAP
jgi:ATP-dependent helicase/nuclease subunit B